MATLIYDTDRMSSLEIAELTGKQHAHIMRDIRSLLAQGASQSNFGLSSYKQPQPRGGYKELPCFELTKKGCLILASGYDVVLREKIIDRWEELEIERRIRTPQTYLEALEALAISEKEKQQIKQHECAAAALTGNIGELPHVADADGAARRKQDEAQAGLQVFSFHDSINSLFPICSAGRAHRAGQSVAFVL